MRGLLAKAWRLLIGSGLGLCVGCLAHDGPEHEIEALTQQMNEQGEAADLLLKRAIEFNVLGKFAEAAKDLERAAGFDPVSAAVQRELSQAYFALGKTNEALATATRALRAFQGAPAEEASLLVTRAEILRARKEYAKALADVDEGIGKHPDNVEWYLMRSELQALLKLKPERVKGLEDGIRATGSGMLRTEWVDALIDDERFDQALEHVERELQQARWKSAWWIRRAKVLRARGNDAGARRDLEAALDELNGRLRVSAADALLLAERGQACELLGLEQEARRDYRAAREKGLEGEWIRDRLQALRGP